MSATKEQPVARVARSANPGLTPLMLNHAAWVTHDVEATAEFYTRVMGMELASTVYDDRVPSTGDPFPYFHIFFRMADGSTIAFFEAPGLPQRPAVTHPAYDIFDHFAMQAKDRAEVDRWHAWLVSNDVEVVGPTDHKGLIYSIYFYDPNGIRLEITTPLDKDWNFHTAQGQADLKAWCDTKKAAQRGGLDVTAELVAFIRKQRQRYK
ncbi:VOC family protein [Peristeroidobacter soli]|jgi:catechol 2,3-dioxygenase-like lactoylglutathione lyase family enzyme|uniref:VOC family protein n=1 Tax=Peristeroidobacter soli TaxID=2497877 RepID=UPI001C37E00D|nr:VOC family protein [Peristeroidobacter soli]